MVLKVKERSPFARLARLVLRSPNVAMVLGDTIHLSGVDKSVFLRDRRWVAHEHCHLRQFREHGFFRFIWLYTLESLRHGYRRNKYEVEARAAERMPAFDPDDNDLGSPTGVAGQREKEA